MKMKADEICTHCGTKFPLDKNICPGKHCFAYRVDDENYNLSLKERLDIKEENRIKKILED